MSDVAVLGLGIMGAGMARQLLAKGHRVTIWNRSPERAEPLVSEGAQAAATPREAVAGAEVVVAMVADNDASRAAWLGDDGALAGMAPGSIAIDASTLDPDWVAELAAAAAARNVDFIDAPVTGSKVQAEGGTLRFFAGGEAEVIDRARPVFDAMGTEVIHFGPVGSGAVMKLANNFASGVQAAAFAEALALIEAKGLDAAKAAAILKTGAPGSPMVGLMADRMTAEDYTPNFYIPLMAKDLGYADALLASAGIDSGIAKAARARFQAAADAGHADKDIAAVIVPLRGR